MYITGTDLVLDLVHRYFDRADVVLIMDPIYIAFIVEHFAMRCDVKMSQAEVDKMVNLLMAEY